ncbi:hypothetical protein [Paenibacillus silviterrae]|uniref:hypothetical protein n=1 Tax=Paenibacillus silviterrae TaxID=3242194 RepID=UPI00254334CD|nr:hypothetical protein [Paenibacillus chinjuensis]
MSTLVRRAQEHQAVRWVGTALLFIVAGVAAGILITVPGMLRLLIFAALFLLMMALNAKNPRVVLMLLILYLPCMSFLRRLLIPLSGWSSFDPLVILPSLVVLLIGAGWFYRIYFMRDLHFDDSRMFRLVRWFLLIHVFQVFNPLQGGLLTGFGGVMFYITPLFWMLLSRHYFDERWMKAILASVMVIGVLGGLYGLKQTYFGFFPFEDDWVRISGYAALMVGSGSRSFSFFTSAAEYAQYVVIAIIIAWVYTLRGGWMLKAVSLLLLAVLWFALFMISSRGPVVTASVAMVILAVFNSRSLATRLMVTLISMAMLVAVYVGITNINPGSNALIAHQVNGLANPMDEEHSTLGLHFAMFAFGMLEGVKQPLGRGLGSTTLAGAKFANTGANSEVDISNMMISDGLIGGTIYLLLVLRTLRVAFAYKNTNTTGMIMLGILIATLGSWSIGGNYSTCALIWIVIGYLDKVTREHPLNRIKESTA